MLVLLVLPTASLFAQTCESGNCDNGEGRMVYSDGSTYEGVFKNALREGKGLWIGKDGERYDGYWHQDLRNGQGKWTSENGDVYDGSWKKNARYGDGKCRWKDGSVYVGDWYSDHRFGRGVMTYANGNVYNGNWEDGHYEGKGAFEWINGEQFWGRWSSSIPQDGQLKFSDGKRYKGVWRKHGLRGKEILLQFICDATIIAEWAGTKLEDNRPKDWLVSAPKENDQVTDNVTVDKEKKEALALEKGDNYTKKEGSKLPVKIVSTGEGGDKPNNEDLSPADAFLEKYDGDFNLVVRELEAEKQLLSEKGLHIRDEMEEIAYRLEHDNLTSEQKAQLEDYLHTLESALISTELALQNALEMTNIVITRLRTTILQKDTAIKEITEESEVNQSKFRLFAVLLSITLIGTLIFFTLWRKLRRQNAKIEMQKNEIELQKGEIEQKGKAIEKQNDNIISSMVYARRIQKALLSQHSMVYDTFPESFILLMPRDIISGDFYWFASIGHKQFLAAVDCTGHGVPGAFMSLVGNDSLNDIVIAKGIHSPDEILEALHNRVVEGLRQDDSNNAQDGMDISLCVIDTQTRTMEFAGAKSPLFIIENGIITEIKGDKFPIGGMQKPKGSTFSKKAITLKGHENCYIFSDGYRDQFGGNDNRKLMKKGFQELLLSIQHLPLPEQRTYLKDYLATWRGEHKQLDDVLVIGFNPF